MCRSSTRTGGQQDGEDTGGGCDLKKIENFQKQVDIESKISKIYINYEN